MSPRLARRLSPASSRCSRSRWPSRWRRSPVVATTATATASARVTSSRPSRTATSSSSSTTARSRTVAISGLAAGERIVGIDVRPRNPTQLYGVGSTSQLYIIDPGSGTATRVGAGFAAAGALEGTAFGFDFNPAVDRIRIISNTGQNLRVTRTRARSRRRRPSGLRRHGSQRRARPPVGVGAGYTFAEFVAPPATPNPTTLYDIEANRDTLVTQVPPNDGTLNTVGSLRLDAGDQVGFDIAGTKRFEAFGLFQRGGSRRRSTASRCERQGIGDARVAGRQLRRPGGPDRLRQALRTPEAPEERGAGHPRRVAPGQPAQARSRRRRPARRRGGARRGRRTTASSGACSRVWSVCGVAGSQPWSAVRTSRSPSRSSPSQRRDRRVDLAQRARGSPRRPCGGRRPGRSR